MQKNDIYFDEIHDLNILLKQCRVFIPSFYNYKKDLIEISSDAVEIRYPGISTSKEEAEEAIKITAEVRLIIRNYFNVGDKKR